MGSAWPCFPLNALRGLRPSPALEERSLKLQRLPSPRAARGPGDVPVEQPASDGRQSVGTAFLSQLAVAFTDCF